MIPIVDIAYITEALDQSLEPLLAALDLPACAPEDDPRPLVEALRGQLDVLAEGARRGAAPTRDVEALGNQTLDLLGRLAAVAARGDCPGEASAIAILALPMACWIARRQGEIHHLAPVVDGIAALANRLHDPADLARLYPLLCEVTAAASPRAIQDGAAGDPRRPWRLLVQNRAIVATRSHRPALMEDAFAYLVEHLPEDASRFFRTGMEQMDLLGYPLKVRAVMQRFDEEWNGRRTLH